MMGILLRSVYHFLLIFKRFFAAQEDIYIKIRANSAAYVWFLDNADLTNPKDRLKYLT